MSSIIERVDGNAFGRAYKITNDEGVFHLPSVTTILSKKPSPKLVQMRLDLGDEKFEEYRDKAARRGSVMHKWLEIFLEKVCGGCSPEYAIEQCQDLVPASPEFEGWEKKYPKQLKIGRDLFYNFYHSGHWQRVNKLVESEIFLYTTFRGGWAGAADFVFIDHDGKLVIWDFKSASDLRNEEDVESYYMQVSAYMFMIEETMCHRKLHPNIQPGMIPDRGEILMMNEKNSMVQQFLLPRTELKDHLKNFIKYRAIFEEDEN